MTTEEFRSAAVEIFGERGFTAALSACLGVERTQIWRYLNGATIPGPVAAAVTCWLSSYRSTGKKPVPVFNPRN